MAFRATVPGTSLAGRAALLEEQLRVTPLRTDNARTEAQQPHISDVGLAFSTVPCRDRQGTAGVSRVSCVIFPRMPSVTVRPTAFLAGRASGTMPARSRRKAIATASHITALDAP